MVELKACQMAALKVWMMVAHSAALKDPKMAVLMVVSKVSMLVDSLVVKCSSCSVAYLAGLKVAYLVWMTVAE